MIKVNLLQNRASTSAKTQLGGMTGANTQTEFISGNTAATGYTTSVVNANNRAMILNFVVLLLIPGALIFYERMELDGLRQQANIVQAEVDTLRTQLEQKKSEVAKSADLREKAKELSNKIDILKKLSRIRLREIKALDFIQSNIPEKVWIRELSFHSGSLVIRGYSVTDDDLTLFVRTIEKSRTFTNVVLLQAREEKSRDGAVKNFEVSCNVEAE